jgi:hypothetical protein
MLMNSIHTIKWRNGHGASSCPHVFSDTGCGVSFLLRAITRRGSIDYLKPARGPVSGVATVGMSAADIAASLTHSPSVDVPISVDLTDAAGLLVARLQVEWFVGNPRAYE